MKTKMKNTKMLRMMVATSQVYSPLSFGPTLSILKLCPCLLKRWSRRTFLGSNGDDVDGSGIVVDDDVVFLLAKTLVPANLLGGATVIKLITVVLLLIMMLMTVVLLLMMIMTH